MKRRVSIILAIATLQCLMAVGAAAQSAPGCFRITFNIWFFPDAIPDGWNCNLPGEGPFSMFCAAVVNLCPPVYWCPTCQQPGGTAASKPINLVNGNTYIQQKDVGIPGLGGGLNLQRTWNSIWPASEPTSATGMFGPNWRSTYEERISAGSGSASGYQVYSRSDGGLWYFGGTGSTLTLASPANAVATLTSGASYWTLTFQNGEQRRFDNTSGSLIAIIDRNGNTTQLAYDGSNRLVTIADPASRHLTFTYGTGTTANLVVGVSSDVSLALSYSYDTQGRLIQVTKPDLTTVNFTYNAQSLITSVTDTSGKVLEAHTYDSAGRGLTGSLANGVEAVTVTYH